ncbi:hypothetical protein NEUTE1DRAFT_61173 [Neurospora tetrasperma FGSC 2508]|uniref:Fungal calcium binding protein domain-containing protein n=1 Tax=Neurospora tetrasperma (strain FGSC 2508 / ATCC MYA-4615 / P0657) TaxID=510951 RepID=F8MHD1_NEUT8|nr:uncharacterized protein NEUTE1DRAFT_61173 [Neurospora tetrasperma FGSC 2508]EGO59594.1 hypothetical protein NEUTE1DRAFT_61173 [Neurospora tetrasperma FGSC 2508]EGZ73722.1 hypothetical protein NEUTE2DRAFT_157133 [Neurospora tetrasperma FGSC 2509]
MLFTTVLTSALAGLAMASPAARMDQSINGLQQRGVLAELCIAACLASACAAGPPACAACLVTCLGTANDGGEVVLDAITLEKAVVDKVEGYVPQITKA